MADGIRPDDDDLVQEIRDRIKHFGNCAFPLVGSECDCGCMEAMDALNRLVAERDCYREALELAASTLVQPGTPTPQFCESASADIRRALAAVREGR